MKLIFVSIIIVILISCDSSPPERRKVETSSDLLGKTFTTKLPLAYKLNLPRFDQVPHYIQTNSSTIFAEEVNRKITGIVSHCAGCMGKEVITTPIRIEYIPIGTKVTVVGEYAFYWDYGSWINGPTNIHTLVVKDEFGNMAEVSELGFKLDFNDERFVNRNLLKEEVFILDSIKKFNKSKTLTLNFCLYDFIEGPVNPMDFISDFQLENEMKVSSASGSCQRGYQFEFMTLQSYLTSSYYFRDWRLVGEWSQIEDI